MIFCKLCVYTIYCMLICQSWMKYWKCSRGRLMYYLFFPSFISQFPIFLLYFIFLYMRSMYITVHIMEACNKDYYYYYYRMNGQEILISCYLPTLPGYLVLGDKTTKRNSDIFLPFTWMNIIAFWFKFHWILFRRIDIAIILWPNPYL